MLSEQIAALTRLGVAPDKAGNLEDAEPALRDALAADPENIELMKALGTVLRLRGQLSEAAVYYRAALQRNHADGAAHRKLGTVLADQMRLDDAIAAWRMAVTYAPKDPASHCCLAIGLLLRGNYREAWPEYEWRRRVSAFVGLLEPNVPMWNGKPLHGQTLLAFAEQGNGDTLQFIRFLSQIEDGRIIVRCPATLSGLISRMKGVDAVIAPDAPLPYPVDVQIALPSLPGRFGVELANISDAPYLTTSSERVALWRQKLAAIPGLKIGLVWAGNPRHADNERRSLPSEMLCWLPRVKGVSYLGLQIGDRAGDADTLGLNVVSLSKELRDFDDTAAVLSLCDLLISVDTAAVHLAGALGCPTWVLLPYSPDWRWMTQRTDSPWYSSLHLYRQEQDGDWNDVMVRVGRDLCRLATGDKSVVRVKKEGGASTAVVRHAPPFDEQWVPQMMELLAAGKRSDAEILCWRMTERTESKPLALNMLGGLRLQDGDMIAAERIISFGLLVGTPNAEAFSNLGVALRRQGRLIEAQHAYRRAIALSPGNSAPAFNLANLLADISASEEALQLYQRVIQNDPTNAGAHYNYANALRDIGRLDEAIAAYRRALKFKPKDPEIHNSLGMCLLLSGRFKEGWEEYAWRKQCTAFSNRTFQQPSWEGQALIGKTLLLYAEQGFGDTIQFLRYVVPAKKRAECRVILEIQPGLASLCRMIPNIDIVVEQGQPLPDFDVQASLMDLPTIFNTRYHSIPFRTPYLSASAARVEKWRVALMQLSASGQHPEAARQATPYRVGLIWAGNPRHKNDRRRSLPLSAFSILPSSPKIAYFSLQVGEHRADLSHNLPNAPIVDLGAYITDFEDTAAIMTHLDLVIACDTAAAHLAGALARTVWTLLPFAPDWRWRLGSSDTLWYPSMHLLRQTSPNDWSAPLAMIAKNLRSVASGETTDSLFVQVEAAMAHGDEQRAAALLRSIRALWPREGQTPKLLAQNAERRMEEAKAAVKTGDIARVDSLFKEITAEAPDFMPPFAEYGLFCISKQRYVDAIAMFEILAPRTPKNISVHYNLALALQRAGRLEEAKESLEYVLAQDPSFYNAFNDLGAVLYLMGRFDEAEQTLKYCLKMDPGNVNAMGNLSVVLRSLGRIEEALENSRYALTILPESPELHWNLSILMLISENFTEGWPEFEWRWRLAGFPSPKRNFTQPQWGGEPLNGKTILIHAEQGFGDTIHFIRYVPLVAARGGRVILEIQPQLRELCRCIPGVVEMRNWGDPQPQCDLQIPMLSLPLVLGVSTNAVLVGCPYITPSPAVLERWSQRLPRSTSPNAPPLRVGVVWAGSVIHTNNRNRSLSLAALAPLWRIPNIEFYSLQKGEAVYDLYSLSNDFPCVNLDPHLTDFAETAGAIAQLDLVITVDTAVAHLVGAMKRPIWCLLPMPPDWRWLLEREDTPYYPTMRLFRQRKGGAWDDVIERTAQALDAYQKERFKVEEALDADAVFSSALNLHIKGDLDGAEAEYRRISHSASSKTTNGDRRADALHHLGLIARQKKRFDEAEKLIRQALEINPRLPAVWSNLGVLLREIKRPMDAIACYRQALTLEPDYADALYNLGNILRQFEDRQNEAIECLQRASSLQPRNIGILNNYGLALKENKRLVEAEKVFRNSLSIVSHNPMSLANLALVLHDLERDAEAVSLCEREKAQHPNDAFFWRAFGLVLKGVERLEEALSAYDQSVRLDPMSGDAHQVRGSCLVALGRLDEASKAIDRALELMPNHAESLWIRGFIDMTMGRLESGWEGMERRWQSKMIYPTGHRFTKPLWNGETLNGGTLLIHAEQGLGDTIHFVRYAEMAAERASGRVIIEVQKPLMRLFSSVKGVDEIVVQNAPPPPFDAHISVMSLPHIFQTSLANIPAKIPYLGVDPALKGFWSKRLERLPSGARRIGLVWAGNPTYKNDRNRSLALETLTPILSLPGCAFVSLQKEGGATAIQAHRSLTDILDLGAEISDFADTAAILSNLDMVITVDTSVAHCAGALGVPTWVFLPFAPDWRWMLNRVDSPWYPSIRLYRQPRRNDWTSVVAHMAADLSA
ncbi:putative UDP-N-acetylglucosamine--peptide N-acetylglucosaminyltransferase SPINDLY [Azospirillaceae bacterium]